MSALMGFIYFLVVCIGIFGWIGDKIGQWRWNRAHR